MLFPISDDDSKLKKTAVFTIVFFVINIAVFLFQLASPTFTNGFSAIPYEITNGTDMVEPATIESGGRTHEIPQAPGPSPIFLTLITSMFMHAGWMHLGGNMLFLWIFGDNVENRFGSVRFVIFYLVSGIAASFAQIMTDPDSVIPTLGASGAIAGVLGAYLVMFPRNKVNAVVLVMIVSLPAWIVIGLWGVAQFFGGFSAIFETANTGGVAYAAHIGGFIAGIVVALICRLGFKQKEPDSVLYRQYRDDDTTKRIW